MDYYSDPSAAALAFLVFHAVMAVALWKMAERTKTEPNWFALVPFLNIALFLKIAKKPLWWLLLFFIPIVNIVTLVVATMALCERFGMNKWWGLVSLISPLNLILYLYLAYGTEKTSATPPAPPAAPHA